MTFDDWFEGLDLGYLYAAIVVPVILAAFVGNWLGRRHHRPGGEHADLGTMTGAALGLVALLLAFSFSIALSRYESRREVIVEEANAIGTTGNYALMLPQPAQGAILGLLHDYTAIRIGLGVPYDPDLLRRDVDASLELQTKLWQQAIAVTDRTPQSLPAYRFVASLNEMTNIHEKRLSALRFHVPVEVVLTVVAVTMVAMGFTGYNAGVVGTHRAGASIIMAVMVGVLIMLIVDLDRPYRGMIQVPVQPLVDAARSLPR